MYVYVCDRGSYIFSPGSSRNENGKNERERERESKCRRKVLCVFSGLPQRSYLYLTEIITAVILQ